MFENESLLWVKADGQIVYGDIQGALREFLLVCNRSKGMKVGDEYERIVVTLEVDKLLHRAEIVSDMGPSCRLKT